MVTLYRAQYNPKGTTFPRTLMAVTPGRNNRLYGWNAYEWPSTYRYVAAGWTVTPVALAKEATVTLTAPAAYNVVGARKGLMWGLRSNQGYDQAARLIPVATPTLRLTGLQPGQSYYLMPVAIAADGEKICGPQSGPMTMQP